MTYQRYVHKASAALSVILVIVMLTTLMAHALYVMSLASDSSAQRMLAEQKRASIRTGLELLVRWASEQYSDFKSGQKREVLFTSWPLGNGRIIPLVMSVESHQDGLALAVSASESTRRLTVSCFLTERAKVDASGKRHVSYEIIGWQETSVL